MKRIFALLIMFTLILTMFGCRGSAPAGGDVLLQQPSGEIEPEDSRGAPDETPTAEIEPSKEPSQASSEGPTEEPTEESTEATTEAPVVTEPTEPPHSHSYSSSTVAATCAAQGYTLHTCACGDSYTDSYTAALGHAYTSTVVAPTTEAGGYTQHTCSRCGHSYTDSYTEQLWWDTEEKVAQICAEANAYIASLGYPVDPTAASWIAPQYTHWQGSSEAWLRRQIWDAISINAADGAVSQYVTYEADPDGGWWVYVKYSLFYFGG